MANETIELLHGYDPKIWKDKYAWNVQCKIDGVPARVTNVGGNIVSYSRQGEQYTSIRHIEDVLQYLLLRLGSSVVGELHIAGYPFKYISGCVRKDVADRRLVFHAFDYDLGAGDGAPYSVRKEQFRIALAIYCETAGISEADCPVRLVRGITATTEVEFDAIRDAVYGVAPKTEGLVLHRMDAQFTPGKRVRHTLKYKPEPTIDIEITGFEEAKDTKTKLGKGMVGRINGTLNRMQDGKLVSTTIGIGPGSLTHNQRTALWLDRSNFRNRIAEVKYMQDGSYDALRQPTFVAWRPDKTEGDVYDPD